MEPIKTQERDIWIEVDVKERMPEDNDLYITKDKHGFRRDMYFRVESKRWYWHPNSFAECDNGLITHWLEKKSDMVVMTVDEFKKVAGDAFDAGVLSEVNIIHNPDLMPCSDKTEYINQLIK